MRPAVFICSCHLLAGTGRLCPLMSFAAGTVAGFCPRHLVTNPNHPPPPGGKHETSRRSRAVARRRCRRRSRDGRSRAERRSQSQGDLDRERQSHRVRQQCPSSGFANAQRSAARARNRGQIRHRRPGRTAGLGPLVVRGCQYAGAPRLGDLPATTRRSTAPTRTAITTSRSSHRTAWKSATCRTATGRPTPSLPLAS